MNAIAELMVGSWIGSYDGVQVNATFRLNDMIRFNNDDGIWEVQEKEGVPYIKLTFIGSDSSTPITTWNKVSLTDDGNTLCIKGKDKPLLLTRENKRMASPDAPPIKNLLQHSTGRDTPYLAQKNLPILTGEFFKFII